MTMKKSIKVTLEDAFSLGRKEGLKEAFSEIKKMLPHNIHSINSYIDARLRSIQDFENNNPFKQKGSRSR